MMLWTVRPGNSNTHKLEKTAYLHLCDARALAGELYSPDKKMYLFIGSNCLTTPQKNNFCYLSMMSLIWQLKCFSD